MGFRKNIIYDKIPKRGIDFFLLKSLVQHHQTRMTLSFPTVPSAPPSESEKCPFSNVNCSHLTAHSTQLWTLELRAGKGAFTAVEVGEYTGGSGYAIGLTRR